MSLINQALRKAQRDRTPNRMPEPGKQTPAAYANSAASGMSPTLVIGLVIAVALLVGLVVGLSVVIFKGDSVPLQPQPQQVAASQPTTKAPNPLAQTAETPPTAKPLTAPISPPANPEVATRQESNVVDELRKAREATEAEAATQAQAAAEKVAADAKTAEEAAARAAAKPSNDIIAWLEQAKLSGVKISATDSKVILNGRAYSVGEVVNRTLGLKLMVVQETRVLFVDNNGTKYMKRL
jgi:cytoskeletal protein RodZ